MRKNVSEQHLDAFYTTFDDVKDKHFDGMIITGAPVELLDFEDVDYWDELCRIMAWSTTNVHSTLHICWGAQAGIYYHYGIPKYELPEKLVGRVRARGGEAVVARWCAGFNDRFQAPHSRYTEVHAADIEAHPSLELIATSDEAGVYLAKSTDSRHFFVFGHPEYDAETLRAGIRARPWARPARRPCPRTTSQNDDPAQAPHATWRAHAQLLYTNWLNYYVYQTTPYDLAKIGAEGPAREGEASQAQGEAQASARLGRGADGRGEHGAGSGAERTPAGEVRSACAAKPLPTPRQRRRRRLRSLLRPPRRTSPVRTGSVGLNRHHHCRGRWQHGIRRIGCLDPSAAIGRALHACTNIVG